MGQVPRSANGQLPQDPINYCINKTLPSTSKQSFCSRGLWLIIVPAPTRPSQEDY